MHAPCRLDARMSGVLAWLHPSACSRLRSFLPNRIIGEPMTSVEISLCDMKGSEVSPLSKDVRCTSDRGDEVQEQKRKGKVSCTVQSWQLAPTESKSNLIKRIIRSRVLHSSEISCKKTHASERFWHISQARLPRLFHCLANRGSSATPS